ncbi:hypothetical protein ABPG72_005224 [Tetrahymena utriculariae]
MNGRSQSEKGILAEATLQNRINLKNQEQNYDQTSQDLGFKQNFEEDYCEEMKEEGQYSNQIQQELDQYNEELESTKSFEIQKDDINEYLDYQSQKTADIQRIRSEIQNLEKEKKYFLYLDKQTSSQRHSFPLQSGSNRNPFKNINIDENHQNSNVKNANNQMLLYNAQKENILNKEQFNSNLENKQINQRNNNNNNFENKEFQQQQIKTVGDSCKITQSNFEGLNLQRGDYSVRNEENHLSQQQLIQMQNQTMSSQYKTQFQQYQIQQQQIILKMQQNQKLQQADQQDIQQQLESNRAQQDDQIKQLEKMIQAQNQFMLGIQNQQEIYYARLYSDIKKQYENLEIQSQKQKKEMEETIQQLKKQLKSSQEENQKKQKSQMKILNCYNTLKIDYEKLVSKWQYQQSILINTYSSQNQQQLSSFFANPYSQGDMEISEYGVSQANLNNLNINSSITSEKVYFRQSKDCQQLEKQAYSNQISSNKELQLTQNSQRENNLSNAYSNLIDQDDDLKQSIDSDGVSVVKGNRSNKSLNVNFPSGKQKNLSNGNSNFVQAVSQFKEEQNMRDSYQQKSSCVKSSISASNTSTSKGTKLLQMQQQQEQFQINDYEQLEEDINLFCDDDDIVVRQSLENNTKLFDNFFSPRGNKTAQTAKYAITGSTSTSSQDKIFKTDEKILEKQYWSSDFRENAETQPFSLQKQSQILSQNNLNQGKKGVDGGSNISTKHKSSQSTQQQHQYNNSQFENQATSLSSQNSLGGNIKNQDKRKSISPNRQQASTRRLTQENKQEDNQQKYQQTETSEEVSSSRYELAQNKQQSQLFKKALYISSQPQNPLFLSHNDNQDFEIPNFSKNQKNHQYNHPIQSAICSSLEGLPKNSQLTPQPNTQFIGGNIKIQDSFNKLLSKSFSKIPNNNFANGEANQSNNNINQENYRKSNNNNNMDSSSSSTSSQAQQTQSCKNKNQKSLKLSSQKLTISTTNTQPNTSKISNNFSQVEFNQSPKLIQKKKHFQIQINQQNSILNQNVYVNTSNNGGGILGTSNSCEASVVNNFLKKEKMVTEPSESTEKSIAKQLSQRQNSSGQSQNQNIQTNNSSDFSHNKNLTDRNTQQNISGSSVQNYTLSAYNNFQKQNSNPKPVSQSQINSLQKKQENQNIGISQSGVNSNYSKQQHGNSYQFSQSKIQNMQNAMSSISQYQIKTAYENNYLSLTNSNSIKSKNLITQSSSQTLNVSSQLDANSTTNNSNTNFQANQFQQYGQLNNLNKKLLNNKVNKLIQGKKHTQLNNYNSAAITTSMNNSENVNLINTTLSNKNHVGMILSPSSRKQLNNQNNLQTNIKNSIAQQKEYGYTSKQRFNTLEC